MVGNSKAIPLRNYKMQTDSSRLQIRQPNISYSKIQNLVYNTRLSELLT